MRNASACHRDEPGGFRGEWSNLSARQDGEFLDLRDGSAPWLEANLPDEFLEQLRKLPPNSLPDGCPAPVEQKRAAEVAVDFHERAGTLTDEVRRRITMYADGAATQRVAHQPNFMPALNIVAQAALCDEMSKGFTA